jgi:molybdopterin/thiamine biosynthesis adenylyltransferase
MKNSTGSHNDLLTNLLVDRQETLETLVSAPLPEPHPAEASLYSRFNAIPGHRQERLGKARIVLVGAGGLNSWIALGLARSGARSLVVLDPDLVERSNLTRQLFFSGDLGRPKATSLVRNLVPHAVEQTNFTGLSTSLEDAVKQYALPADILVVGIDRNDGRLAATRLARQRGIPAVFAMLSRNGMRCHIFLQGSEQQSACLWCALPNLDPQSASPCAAAIIHGCYLVAALALFFVHRALMGWPAGVEPFNWREVDLLGINPDKAGFIQRRARCPVCSEEPGRP